MRIIAGKNRGQSLDRPKIQSTRPTSDRVRETLFNILAHGVLETFEGLSVLDVFGGSGALAFESLSRGASHAFIWDINKTALETIKLNAKKLKMAPTIMAVNGCHPPKAEQPVDLIFLDPPYGEGLIPKALQGLWDQGWIKKDTVIVAEIGATERIALPSEFTIFKERAQGPAKLLFIGKE